MDGKLMLVTNVQDMAADEVVRPSSTPTAVSA
jgi:hypothetical protein